MHYHHIFKNQLRVIPTIFLLLFVIGCKQDQKYSDMV